MISREQEIFDLFKKLTERLWKRLMPMLGETATTAIFNSAYKEISMNYPFLDGIIVDEKGINMDVLINYKEIPNRSDFSSSLIDFIDNLFGLITDLTGDLLVSKVSSLLEEFKANVAKG